MQGFTLVDGIVLAVIVISAVLAYARGLVREGALDPRLDRRGICRLFAGHRRSSR